MNDAKKWRCFVGQWDDGNPDRAHQDGRDLTWEQARDVLHRHAALYRDDECGDCREQGRRILADLGALPAGAEYWNELEGEDLFLIPDIGFSAVVAERQRRIHANWVQSGLLAN